MGQVQFAAGAYQSRNRALDDQRCVNFFSEQAPSKEAEALVGVFGCPGLTAWAEAAGSSVRAYRIMQGLLYAVIGSGLYSVTAAGTVTLVSGSVAIDGTGPVSISDNGHQIVFVTGTNGYVFQLGGLNQTLAATAVAGAMSVSLVSVNGGVAVGDPFALSLDNGSTLYTTVASISGTTIGLANEILAQASVGALGIDNAATFFQIPQTDAVGFYPASTVTYIDTYFMFDRAGTNQVFYSAPNDGTNYPGNNYDSAESNPGNLMAVASLHETLVLVCERHIELWQDTGNYPGPFSLIGGAVIQRGTGAPLSVLQEDNSLFLLGNDLIYYRIDNYLPVRVSTHVMETAWAGYAITSDAFSFVVVWQGHKFIHVTFPSAGATWVFDIATNLWHERESWAADNTSLGRWRGNCAIQCYNKVLVGDAFSGQIAIWDYEAFTEFGNTMRGLLTSPPLHKDRKRIFMSLFETYWETGVGNTDAPSPNVVLDWSDDGARTWSKTQRPGALGVQGAYQQRTRWLRLGQSRTRTLRLTVTDPVRRNLVGAYLDLSVGL